MNVAYLSIGSNIDRKRSIEQCIELLAKHFFVEKLSSIYETWPVGNTQQEPFYNLAAKIRTSLDAYALLDALHTVEDALGRIRKEKWGPRSIDIDIIFFNDENINNKVNNNGIIIPHPEAHKRAFVLVPLLEIEPELVHPTLKKRIKDIRIPKQQVKKIEI